MGSKRRKALKPFNPARVPVLLNGDRIGEAVNPSSAADKLCSKLREKDKIVTRETVLAAMKISRNAYTLLSWHV